MHAHFPEPVWSYRRFRCWLAFCGLLAGAFFFNPAWSRQQPTPSSTHQEADSLEAAVIRLVNQHRATLQLPPLREDSVLSALARTHSRNMASGKAPFTHGGFDDRKKIFRKAYKLGMVGRFGENIAEGHLDAEGVVELWLGSEGHRRNIEGSYQLTGVGISRSKEGALYFTQLFTTGP